MRAGVRQCTASAGACGLSRTMRAIDGGARAHRARVTGDAALPRSKGVMTVQFSAPTRLAHTERARGPLPHRVQKTQALELLRRSKVAEFLLSLG